MATEKKIICPLMNKECIEDGSIVNGELHGCKFWIKVKGTHPQTGTEIDEGDCAISWNPILLINNTQMQRQTTASIESFRNEMVIGNEKLLSIAATPKNLLLGD